MALVADRQASVRLSRFPVVEVAVPPETCRVAGPGSGGQGQLMCSRPDGAEPQSMRGGPRGTKSTRAGLAAVAR